MARQPRLAVAGLPHLVTLDGLPQQPLFVQPADRAAFVDALREACAAQQVAVLAYVLLPDHVHLLLTPAQATGLSLAMQALGRRYVAGYNRRHRRSGPLWAGRFRTAVVQPGAALLEVMLFIDLHAQRSGLVAQPADADPSSAPHHLGLRRDSLISPGAADAAYWALGNTPFEREAAYRRRLDEGLPLPRVAQIAQAARSGWAIGEPGFAEQLAQQLQRPLAPRKRGRPAGTSIA